jgi:hypothetical protein
MSSFGTWTRGRCERCGKVGVDRMPGRFFCRTCWAAYAFAPSRRSVLAGYTDPWTGQPVPGQVSAAAARLVARDAAITLESVAAELGIWVDAGALATAYEQATARAAV